MKLFCITNHSPLQVQVFLEKAQGTKTNNIYVHPVGSDLTKEPMKPFMFLLNISDFLKNQVRLNNKYYKETIIFLFTSPFRAIELSNAVMLDVEQNKKHTYKYTFRSLQKGLYTKGLAEPIEKIERNEDYYLYKIVEDVKYGSLLTPLMTFIYTLPKTTHQTQVKEAVVNYLFGSKTDIAKQLEKKKVTLGAKTMVKLETILNSEPGLAYKKAIEYHKENPEKAIKVLEKKFDVKSYELKYLKKILASQKFYKKSIDKTTKELSRE